MTFEFDPVKSLTNKQKHGVDFVEIQELWNDDRYVQIIARTIDEPRFLVIGKYQRKIWSCIVTFRKNNVRIISARRARPEEELIYERI